MCIYRTSKFMALLMLAVLVGSAKAQSMSHCRDKSVCLMQQFLQAAYPDLVTSESTLWIDTGHSFREPWTVLTTVGFHIYDKEQSEEVLGYIKGQPPPPKSPPPKLLVEGTFRMDIDGRIDTGFFSAGTLPETQKDENLRKLVESHPEWTEEQTVEAIKKAGAKYGPWNKQGFLNSIPLQGLAKIVGPLTVESAEFLGLSGRYPGTTVILEWQVVVRSHSRRGRHQEYVAAFEPFDGRIVMFSRY